MKREQITEQTGEYSQRALLAGRRTLEQMRAKSADGLEAASTKLAESAAQLEDNSPNRSKRLARATLNGLVIGAGVAATRMALRSRAENAHADLQSVPDADAYPKDQASQAMPSADLGAPERTPLVN